ncbi:MAG: hypothetical protein QM516_10110 [Limnohabitans sp.]|nr:hypothetical protein [Limnohabitans sp.]
MSVREEQHDGLNASALPEATLIAAALANVERNGMRAWGLHGLAHWWRVRHNGLLVAEAMGANPRVVRLFAIFHDSQREDDGYDREHGPRAAAWLARVRNGDSTAHGACKTTLALLRAIPANEYDALHTACELHTSATHHDNPSVAACFVADRLDLSRVGFRPDPNRMPKSAALSSLLTRELIDAAIAREKLGLAWIGGNEIETVWQVRMR